MSQLRERIQRHPGVAFASQYALAEGPWNSLVSFHNYFDEVFPGKQVAVTLELAFHDVDGRETLFHEAEVAPGTSTVIDCKELGVSGNGIVAVSAVPRADLQALADGKFKIRTQVSTGFYMTWDRDGRWRDTMHEWADVTTSVSSRNVQHIGFSASSVNIEHGVVLMNPSIEAASTTGLELSLSTTNRGGRVAKAVSLPTLPAMGSRVVRMAEVFPGFSALLAQHGRLVLSVTSAHAAPPLTAEWHPSGDFHFHHI